MGEVGGVLGWLLVRPDVRGVPDRVRAGDQPGREQMIGAWILFGISLTALAITLSRNSAWLKQWKAKRKSKQLELAVKMVESYGFTVAEIATKAGTDYIRAADGSWRKIGRGDETNRKKMSEASRGRTRAANRMIADAIRKGEDTTGLGTVRDAVALMEENNHNPMEICFPLGETKYNVMIEIIGRNGVPLNEVGGKIKARRPDSDIFFPEPGY